MLTNSNIICDENTFFSKIFKIFKFCMLNMPFAIRTEHPSIHKIILGIFRIAHLKQFLIFIMSISFLLFLIRVLYLKTMVIYLGSCVLLLIILDIIERITRTHLDSYVGNFQQLSSIADGTLFDDNLVRYSILYYSKNEFLDENEKCNICFQVIEEGSKIAQLECHHLFHLHCVEKYNNMIKSCPICKAVL